MKLENRIVARLKRWSDKLKQTRASRRSFLKALAVGAGSAAIPVKEAKAWSFGDFFKKHYKEMTPEDKKELFARLEEEAKQKYDVNVSISDPPPIEGVKFVYCLNLSKCNGSRRCVEACVKENNQSRDPQIQYIKVLEIPNGSMDLEKADIYYDDQQVPQKEVYYMPIQCQQCDESPCHKVCPVDATWKEKDGIVVIDYDWCIGCRYCEAACPYEARRFNFATPNIPKEEINPDQGYLSNRIRPRGVVEKCHFCLHRTRNGLYPACLEACPTGARKFGNILDPKSEVRAIIENKRVFVLKEDLGTKPSFFYFFD